jgi:hypothetical protein
MKDMISLGWMGTWVERNENWGIDKPQDELASTPDK